MICLLMILLSIFRWRNSHAFLKQPAEIKLIINSYHGRNLFHGHGIFLDQGCGLAYPQIIQIIGNACANLRFKNPAQIKFTFAEIEDRVSLYM